LLDRHHRAEFGRRETDLDVERTSVTDVDDLAPRTPICRAPLRSSTDEEASHIFDWALRCRTTDPYRSEGATRTNERVQTLETQCKVRTALVTSKCMDLIDDHRVNGTQ
jgi:hypothetical protein